MYQSQIQAKCTVDQDTLITEITKIMCSKIPTFWEERILHWPPCYKLISGIVRNLPPLERFLFFCSSRYNSWLGARKNYPKDLGGTEEFTPRVDSSVPLTHNDPKDLGLICLEKKHKIRLRINLVPRALVTLVQRNGKTKTTWIQYFSSTFHWPTTEHAQLYRKLINNNFVPRFPIQSRERWMCKRRVRSLRKQTWRTKHRESLCLDL